jgi:integrase
MKAAGPSLKKIATFLLYTDTTVREALQLEWSQVDLARRRIHLSSTRHRRGQLIVLDLRVAEMLGRFLHRNGKVFHRPDGGEYAAKENAGGHLRSAFRGACERAGIPRITPRALRRIWIQRQIVSDFQRAHNDAA